MQLRKEKFLVERGMQRKSIKQNRKKLSVNRKLR